MSGPPVYGMTLQLLDIGFENIADLTSAKQANDIETRLEQEGRRRLDAGRPWSEAKPFFDKAEELDQIELRLHTGVIQRQRMANGLIDRMLTALAGLLGMRKSA